LDATLIRALVLLVPMSLLLMWSFTLFVRARSVASLLQLVGAGCLVLVGLTHVSEALGWFPFMHWGSPTSIGHYLDFSSAIVGITLLPIGLLCRVLTERHATDP
jgi:formate hydrogenlyase subunit 3/multisubunit Na+/H+ antiporter MnhD subunit